MNQQEVKEVELVIEQRVQELKEMIDNTGANNKKDDAPGESNMEKSINTAINHSTLQKAEREIVMLKRNLSWIKSDDGGYCESCGEEIPLKRIKVVPQTRLCVNCSDKAN